MTPRDPQKDKLDAEVAVFLKTYEEAPCADKEGAEGTVCDFKYVDPTPTVTEMTTEFDKDTA
jgi:hypothetical protein